MAGNLSVVVASYLLGREKRRQMNRRQLRRQADRINRGHGHSCESRPERRDNTVAVREPRIKLIGTHPEANNVALTVTYQEVTGRRATLDGMIAILRTLNVHGVLQTIATLNNRFCIDTGLSHQELYEQQISLVRQLCSPDLRRQLFASSFGRRQAHAVFHRQQQLFVLRYALLECPYDVGAPWEIDALHRFAEACLMANDLVNAERPVGSTDETAVVLTQLILDVSEFSRDNDLIQLVSRATQLWIHIAEVILPQRKKTGMDFGNAFERATGIELDALMRILYMVIAQGMRTDMKDSPREQYIVNVATFFANTAYSADVARGVLSILSCPLPNIKSEITERTTKRHGDHFAALERYPLIEVADGIYVLYDLKLLVGWLTRGIWWTIHDSLPDKEREKFRGFFGEVFEIYICHLFSYICSRSTATSFYQGLKFTATAEICDGIVETEDAWILLESKAALLKHISRYSNDLEALRSDILDRFWGKEKAPKGPRQLARAIKRLLVDRHGDTSGRLHIGQRKAIYPVLVSYDTAICNRFVARWLDELLRQEIGILPPGAPLVKPLTILSAEDVESITSLCAHHSVPELIDSYHTSTAPLPTFRSHILQEYASDINLADTYSYSEYMSFHELVAGEFTK